MPPCAGGLLSLTIHEAIVCDENLDPDGRDRALNEARELISEMHRIGERCHWPGRRRSESWPMPRCKLLRKLGEDSARRPHG